MSSNVALTLHPGMLIITRGARRDQRDGSIAIAGSSAVLQELARQFGPGLRPENDETKLDRHGIIAWREIGGHVNFTTGLELRALFVPHEGPMIMLGASAANCAVCEYDNAGVRFISVGGLIVTEGSALMTGTAGSFNAPLSLCFLE